MLGAGIICACTVKPITPDMDLIMRRWRVGQCARRADQPWLTALKLQPTYVRCPEGKPSWLPTVCLIKAGTLLNIGCTSITGRTRDCEC
jgi:hypothetical protein